MKRILLTISGRAVTMEKIAEILEVPEMEEALIGEIAARDREAEAERDAGREQEENPVERRTRDVFRRLLCPGFTHVLVILARDPNLRSLLRFPSRFPGGWRGDGVDARLRDPDVASVGEPDLKPG